MFNFQFKKIVCCFIFLILLSSSYATVKTDNDYQVQRGDLLTITVLDEEELTRDVKVTFKGQVLYPLLGVVEVKGKTILEITELLTERLSKYIISPQVSVFIRQYAKIYIYGEVIRPGAYELSEKLTIIQAIAVAGGLKERANPKKIKIKRTINGKIETLIVDLTEITHKQNSEIDIELYPNDVIIVLESFL